MVKKPDSNEENASTPTDRSGYLYHKQRPEPRSRTAGRPSFPKPRPRPTHATPAKHLFQQNIKVFFIVLACMIGLLMLSMTVSRKSWEARQAKVQKKASPVAEERGETSTPRGEAQEPVPEETMVDVRRTVRTQVDTDRLRKAVALSKSGDVMAENSQPAEAIKRYREALEIWPYLTDSWAKLGRVYLGTKEYAKAQVALTRAMENAPDSVDILNDLAVSLLYQNEAAKSIELLETIAEIDTKYAPCHFNLALCHIAMGKQDKAVEALQHYLMLEPGDPRALKELAFLFASSGNYALAINQLKTALSEAPDWPPLYFDAAATSALMGRIEDAVNYLDKAEVLTDPRTVYQVYQQPAFKRVRPTEIGGIFERELADRARAQMAQAANVPQTANANPTVEPLSSETPSL